jgi:hypothetical protein
MDNIWSDCEVISTEQQPKFHDKFTPPKSFDKLQIKWPQWLTTRKPKFVDRKANELFIIGSPWTAATL